MVAVLILFATSCGPAGRTVTLVSQSPASVVLEYTHVWPEELPAAIRIAQTRCQQYGRHARILPDFPKRLDEDRSIVAFDCVVTSPPAAPPDRLSVP